MNEVMLKIDNVSKMYKLGQIGGTTLRDELQRKHAKLRGKEDPTKKIGAKEYAKGETFMALNGISFEVKKGERIGIIGHNGAGKSTLLKLISRVTAPTGGAISMNGRVASMLEVGTGFHGELTGRENIYMNGAILGMTKKEIDAKMEDIIEFSECRQFIDTPVKRYSSGMYVKLAFSVAAHLDSEIMIMDEVLAVGDMAFQKKCLDKMKSVSEEDCRTILYVSHNMNTIRQLCDRVVVLDHGKVVFDGGVEEGIDVYSSVISNHEKCINVWDEPRNLTDNSKVKIKSIELVGNDEWKIATGEKLRYKLTIHAYADLQSLKYRSRLFSSDETSITVLKLKEDIQCIRDHDFEVLIEADTSSLAPGKYRLSPCLYIVNEYGAFDFCDHLDGVVSFNVEIAEGFNDNVIWDKKWWGYVQFPPMQLLGSTQL